MPDKQPKRALVLSGGGGRGAYHVGALRFLHEHEWKPDIVVGTSIGAVNGAALASGHDAHSLWALWRRLRTGDVQKGSLLNPLKGHFLFDTQPLRETLLTAGWVDFERINAAEPAIDLRITATEVETGQLHVFGNSPDAYPGSRMQQEEITLDHILASCSIPLVYPSTRLAERKYWDGATVSNTPLGAAIDAGAEEIVVVLMTPWKEDDMAVDPPRNLLQAASLTLDWALLASFRSDMKMFRRVNEMVRMQTENRQLRAIIAELLTEIGKPEAAKKYADANNDGIPDILEEQLRELPEPVIVAPRKPIPADQIIRYDREDHEKLHRAGYEDTARAWERTGREVEGGVVS